MRGEHNSILSFNFYNDRVKEIMASADMEEPFTYIPIKAKHMELVGGNAVVFGKITEGYDIITPEIDIELSYEKKEGEGSRYDLNVAKQVTQRVTLYDEYFGEYYTEISGVYIIYIPSSIRENAIYYINVIQGTYNKTASYTAIAGDDAEDVADGLRASLIANGMDIETGPSPTAVYLYGVSRVWWWLYGVKPVIHEEEIFVYNITAYVFDLTLGAKYPILKCGAVHGFGIVYKDKAGRTCSVMKTGTMNVYIPFYSKEGGNDLDSVAILTFLLNHLPPEWADTYEIVYYGNISMDWFLQMRVDNIIDLFPFGLANHYGANIRDTIDYTREMNPRWKVADYEWQEGDRIRFIGCIDEDDDGALIKYDELYDYEIEETGTMYGEAVGEDFLYFQANDPPPAFVGEKNIIAEIYRPRKGLGKTTPYGTGMIFEIGVDEYGHHYHKGDVDQILAETGESVISASIFNTANDAYKFSRLNYESGGIQIFPFWAESIAPSDWWIWNILQKLTSNGFPFLDDLSQKQTVLDERIRHGGKIITGTRTNNIAHFTFEDYLDLPKKNGDITGLREVGYTLKVLQMHKETSIYIERIVNFNADGTEEFTLIDRFLGTVYPLDTDYGCQHPDSVTVNGRNLYYWDNSQGALIRSAPNGQLSLSDLKYKVSRWYRDLVKWIQNNGGQELLEVYTGANNEHEEIWINFRMDEEVRGLIFSEKDSRYKSRIDQKTESYVHLGVFFAHMYHQRLWIMNIDEGQDYLSWAGTPTHAEIEFVSNINVVKNKVFNAVAFYTDHQWESESKSVVIPEEASAVNEIMKTNIAVWDRREGIFYGKILKDENSLGNFVSIDHKKMNGREMRGRYCFFKFKTEEHDEKVRVDLIIIFSTPSERSG